MSKSGVKQFMQIDLHGIEAYWDYLDRIEVLFAQTYEDAPVKTAVWRADGGGDCWRYEDSLLVLWTREDTALFEERRGFVVDIRPTLKNGLDVPVQPAMEEMYWSLFDNGGAGGDSPVIIGAAHPFEEDPSNAEAYRQRALRCMASWLTHDYVGKAITTESGTAAHGMKTAGVKTVYQYGFSGYIKAAIGDFDYDQTVDVTDGDGTVYEDCRAMEMDCCTFASLITKGYDFDSSIYKDAALRTYEDNATRGGTNTGESGENLRSFLAKAINQATWPYRADRTAYIGYDGNNNVTTDEWAETLFYSGNRFNLFSIKTAGAESVIYPEAVKTLRSGDLVFWGSGKDSRKDQFYGIHHQGIYVRSLDELNQYAPGYKFRISDTGEEDRYDDGRYGYIVHVYSSGVPNRWVNVLRVDTMRWAAEQLGANDPWHRVWTVHVVPNTLNVSGGMEAATSWRNAWGKAILTNWHDTSRSCTIRTANGGAHSPSFGQSGLLVLNNVDFNSMIESGLYRFSYDKEDAPLSTNQHMPEVAMGYLEVVNPVNDRFPEHGTETAFCTTQTYTAITDTEMRIYKRWTGRHETVFDTVDGEQVAMARRWTPWYKVFDSTAATAIGTVQKVLPMAEKYF